MDLARQMALVTDGSRRPAPKTYHCVLAPYDQNRRKGPVPRDGAEGKAVTEPPFRRIRAKSTP